MRVLRGSGSLTIDEDVLASFALLISECSAASFHTVRLVNLELEWFIHSREYCNRAQNRASR